MKDRMFAVLSDHEIPADHRAIFIEGSVEPFIEWKPNEETRETVGDTARKNWLRAVGKKYPQLDTSDASDVFARSGMRIDEAELREIERKFEAMGHSHENEHFIFRGGRR